MSKAKRICLMKKEPNQLPEWKEGIQARLDRKNKESCPYKNDLFRKHLWLGGYNDTDLMMKERANK